MLLRIPTPQNTDPQLRRTSQVLPPPAHYIRLQTSTSAPSRAAADLMEEEVFLLDDLLTKIGETAKKVQDITTSVHSRIESGLTGLAFRDDLAEHLTLQTVIPSTVQARTALYHVIRQPLENKGVPVAPRKLERASKSPSR